MQNYVSTKEAGRRLANGMDVRNTDLEKLGYKVTEAEIITDSAKAAGDETATNVQDKSQGFPHVRCAILYPSRSKLLLLAKFSSKPERISNLILKSTSVLLP